MKTIHKYPLQGFAGPQQVELTGDIVHIDDQAGVICIWAEAGTQEPDKRYFEIIGTGHKVTDRAIHVGSVLSGSFVWHIYEHPPLTPEELAEVQTHHTLWCKLPDHAGPCRRGRETDTEA